MIKQCLINFFKRFKYFFICFGMILVGFIGAGGLFYGGLYLTLFLQGSTLTNQVFTYLSSMITTLKPTDFISLSFIGKVYNDVLNIAGDSAFNLKIGLTLSGIVALFAIYGTYKGSAAIVNYINKRQLRNTKTKHGFIPFIIKLVIGLAFSFLLLVLLHLWTWSFIFVLFFYVLIDSFESIITIRYIYFSDIKLKQFIVSKAFFKVMSLFLIYQYVIILLASLIWLGSPIIALLIMVPVLAYSETNIQYTIIKHFKLEEVNKNA